MSSFWALIPDNIIYLDSNRELVLCSGGCPRLIDQLSRCLDKSAEDGQSDRIKCISCGCILNVANSNGWCVYADYIQNICPIPRVHTFPL